MSWFEIAWYFVKLLWEIISLFLQMIFITLGFITFLKWLWRKK